MENNENSYHYLDPDLKYTDNKGLLHNLANIQNEDVAPSNWKSRSKKPRMTRCLSRLSDNWAS